MSAHPQDPAVPAAIPADWIVADWPVHAAVHTLITTRRGGVSQDAWGAGAQGGMNLGLSTGDDPERVQNNRALLARYLPAAPRWLSLQHGSRVVRAESIGAAPVYADAAIATTPDVVCCVTVADCLPVLLADRSGSVVAATHAGWRGLAAGVIQATVGAMRRLAGSNAAIDAFLGPSIGPAAYEVGEEVLDAMLGSLPQAQTAFKPLGGGKFLADLPGLARQALMQVEVHDVYGGRWCTASDPERFYSFRRDRVTGRHAALIWLRRPV